MNNACFALNKIALIVLILIIVTDRESISVIVLKYYHPNHQ